MQGFYSFLTRSFQSLFPLLGKTSTKLGLSVSGRKDVFTTLENTLDKSEPVIWVHAASLGEYEQAVPVLEALKRVYSKHQIVITFFSPSGYEIKKDNAFAKVTTYLPLDTPHNAKKFLDIITPEMVFFIKYEFWPNYLTELKNRKIRTFLISGIFRTSQPFYQFYGKWMISSLHAFEHFFLQDASSAAALKKLGFENYTVNGDTRFDRVSQQIGIDNTLPFVETFKGNDLCIVCGSTWPEDESVLLSYINTTKTETSFIIAPHEINEQKINQLINKLEVPVVRYSNYTDETLKNARVLIIDTIGVLAKIYSYADISYVGGAMGTTGLHNILEPATFGVPLVIGTNYEKFPEAKKLRQLAGLYAVSNTREFTSIVDKLILNDKFRSQTGMITGHFVNSNTGATKAVMDYLAI